MRRPWIVPVLALALTTPAAQGADHADIALNILPSGQTGRIPTPLPGADRQARMYDALTPLFDTVTTADLPTYFKSARLGDAPCPCRAERTTRRGVTLVRDRFSVPHITGRTRDDVTWATGWVVARDREALLAAGRYAGRLAAIGAPSTAVIGLIMSGVDVRPSAAIDRRIDREQTATLRALGREGAALRHDIDVYVTGVNAGLRSIRSRQKPVTRVDVYAANATIGQLSGQGGENEAQRSQLYDALRDRLGDADGQAVWDDITEHDDPDAPATIDRPFPFLPVPATTPGAGNRVLDAGSFRAVPGANDLAGTRAVDALSHASNFLLVGASRSATGHPVLVAGPQLGYNYPGLEFELDLKGPGYAARGSSAPGAPGTIIEGRNEDAAWTLTSATSDLIDHYVYNVCGNDTTYEYRGRCRRMKTVNAGTVARRPFVFHETVHGAVFGYGTVDGRRVAIARKRASQGNDILFQRALKAMTLGQARGAAGFQRAFATSPFTFNAAYADDRDIALYSAGLLPRRAPDVDPRLPTNGDGNHEWRGVLTAAEHAQAINPDSGMLVNWNNRPAPGWGAATNNWEYGSVHRVQLLQDALAAREQHDPGSVVAAMNKAATQDLRALRVFGVIADVLRTGPAPSPREERMLALVDEWRAVGASVLDRDGDGRIDHAGAAVVEAAYPRIADAVLAPVLGPQLAQVTGFAGADADQDNDYTGGRMGYVHKDLTTLLGRPLRQRFRMRYCGGGDLPTCRATLWEAMKAAGDELAATQGPDPDGWRARARRITFAPFGVFPIRYTNRPSSFQQVMSFRSHRR